MTEHLDSTNRKNKNSTLAALGFVIIVIILIVSAANYVRIQEPRFRPIEETIQMESHEGAHEEHAPAAEHHSQATREEKHHEG